MTKFLKKNWREIPIGGKIKEAGSSKDFKTGGWAVYEPIWDKEKCTKCLTCVNFCPENCIYFKNPSTDSTSSLRADSTSSLRARLKVGPAPLAPLGCGAGEKIEIDYNYCKGCGICANECPTKAIIMKIKNSK